MQQEHWKKYFGTFHTSPAELADIARRAYPKLLVVYHQSLEKLPESDLIEQVKRNTRETSCLRKTWGCIELRTRPKDRAEASTAISSAKLQGLPKQAGAHRPGN